MVLSRGTLLPQRFVFLYGPWAHLCLNTLCFYRVHGHNCALKPCLFIWSRGTLVPQHLVFVNGTWAHLCLNALGFYMVTGQTCVSKLCVFKWSRAHLCINTLCYIWSLGCVFIGSRAPANQSDVSPRGDMEPRPFPYLGRMSLAPLPPFPPGCYVTTHCLPPPGGVMLHPRPPSPPVVTNVRCLNIKTVS